MSSPQKVEWGPELVARLIERGELTAEQGRKALRNPRALTLLAEREYLRCLESFSFFYFNYWYIQHPPGSPTPGWHLPNRNREYQVIEAEKFQQVHDAEALPEEEREVSFYQIRLKARQIGYTTLAMALAGWCGLFHPGHSWLVISQDEDAAKDTIATKFKPSIETHMAPWILERSARKIDSAAHKVTFEKIVDGKPIHTTITAQPTTSNTGRSRSVFGCIYDEAARRDDYGAAFNAADKSTYGPQLVFSTANGMGNWFHDVWLDSEKEDSQWENGFWPWYVVPERTETWYERKKGAMRNQLWEFYQEYPATVQEAFAKSGQVAFDLELVEAQPVCEPEYWFSWDMAEGTWVECEAPEEDTTGLLLGVWELPQTEAEAREAGWENPNYVLGADVAAGGEDGDYSAFSVIDVNTGREVAAFRGRPDLDDYSAIVEETGRWYANALIGVENNAGFGATVITDLRRNNYPRLYRSKTIGKVRQKRESTYGFNTNKQTKAKMIADFRRALKDKSITIRDPHFVFEAKTFVSDNKGSFKAVSKKHDDVIMAKMLAWQMALEVERFPYVPKPEEIKESPFQQKYGTVEEILEWLYAQKERRGGVSVGYIPSREDRMNFIR